MLFERPKTGFVLPYDQWLRRGMSKVMDQTMRDPETIKPTGLGPAVAAYGRLSLTCAWIVLVASVDRLRDDLVVPSTQRGSLTHWNRDRHIPTPSFHASFSISRCALSNDLGARYGIRKYPVKR